MKDIKVYVASPYGRRAGNNIDQCECNVNMAIGVARILIKQGHIPFVPVLYHFVHKDWPDTPDEERWWEMCAIWLPDCDVVLRVSGHSIGADKEVELARKLSIPVVFSVEELEKLND